MQRIMIVGQPGSGKSMLAKALSLRTGLPIIHVDKLNWQAGWVERSKADKTRVCQDAEQQSHWIFEGGHSATWPSRVARADMLIVLYRPIGLRLWRVLRRTVTGLGRTRADMAEGCPQRLSLLPEFTRYMWATRSSAIQKLEHLAASAPPGCEVILLCSDGEVDAFLARFGQPKHRAAP
jgi:adenylate kinase family enzyme